MSQYIWKTPKWTEFKWDQQEIWPKVANAKFKQGQLLTKLSALAEGDRTENLAHTLALETQQTAKIEGEIYAIEQVRSSINRRFGLSEAGLPVQNRSIEGLVEVLLDATIKANEVLDKKRLCSWHGALFPTGISGLQKIMVGEYRNDKSGNMEIVSGAIGHEQVHYIAPPAEQLNKLMDDFLNWWEKSKTETDNIIRAGMAHAYFVLLHPFEDGNGRIARALTDMALAQGDGMQYRYYSMSSQLMQRRKEYYLELEQAGRGSGDLSEWLSWFTSQFELAIDEAQNRLANVFSKAAFWQQHQDLEVNSRQRKITNMLLEAGPKGFIGGMSTRKYVAINKVSRASAYRELNDLVAKGILQTVGIGRGLRYEIKFA
jgi:Fic family protein